MKTNCVNDRTSGDMLATCHLQETQQPAFLTELRDYRCVPLHEVFSGRIRASKTRDDRVDSIP